MIISQSAGSGVSVLKNSETAEGLGEGVLCAYFIVLIELQKNQFLKKLHKYND